MARRLLSKLTRSLTAEWAPDSGVHFHGGAHGRPYPCHDPRCTSPGLDVTRALTGSLPARRHPQVSAVAGRGTHARVRVAQAGNLRGTLEGEVP